MNAIYIVKKVPFLLKISSIFYNIFFSPSLLRFYLSPKREVSLSCTFLRRVKIKATGGAKIYIGPRTIMQKCVLIANGIKSRIHIQGGGGTNIKNSRFTASMGNGSIYIDEGFTSEGCYLKAHENKEIQIGKDCMFSADINISTTDFHSIVSLNEGQRLNHAKNIKIGNHVWLGRCVNILKGTIIADDVIIGMGSTVSGKIMDSHALYAGTPVRLLKEEVSWKRSLS